MIKYISNKLDENKKNIRDNDLIERYSKLAVVIDHINAKGEQNVNSIELEKICSSIIRVHNELSCEILPATPVSIKYTEFSERGFLKKNKTINWIIRLTIIALVLVVILNFLSTITPFFIFRGNKFEISVSQQICNLFIIISGSALGSGFYTLTTVRKYLVNRTYSPRYNPTYIIRFILGITSGTILVFIVEDDPQNFQYSIALWAIIGGFAADIVAIILTGIAESLKRALTNPNKQSSTSETKEETEEQKKISNH